MATLPVPNGWVVYQTPADGGVATGVCPAHQWPGLVAERGDRLTLLHAGIASEGAAERLARGTAGDPVPRARPSRPPAARPSREPSPVPAPAEQRG